MWLPLKLERLTLATPLSPDECRARLARTTAQWIDFFRPKIDAVLAASSPADVAPVRGLVMERGFYLEQGVNTRAWLRTWISGQIRSVEQHIGASESRKGTAIPGAKTVIEVAIGPNRVAALFLTLLAAMLGAGATIATVLAFTSPFETWRSVILSWTVVATFIAVFFVFPATDHPGERAFLLEYLRRTLEATEQR